MSVTQRGSRESFSDSGSDTSGGLRLDAEVTGQTGDFTINATVSTSGVFGGSGITISTSEVTVRPFGFSTFKNQVRRIPGRVATATGASAAFLLDVSQTSFPSVDVLNHSGELESTEILPNEYQFGPVEFPPVRVPVDGDILDQIDPLILTVEVQPARFIERFTQDLPSVDLEIPPEAFLIPIDVESFGCAELYPRVQSNLDRLEQRIASAQSLQDDLSTLQSLRSDILSRVSTGSLDQIRDDMFSGLNPGTVESWEERLNSVSSDPIPGSDTLGSIETTLDQSDALLENVEIEKCSTNFRSRFSQVSGRIERLRELSDRIEQLQNEIADAIPGDIQFLSCVQRSWGGVNGSDLDKRLNDLRDLSLRDLDPEEVIRAQNTVEDIQSDIQSIPSDDAGGCRQEFLSRLRDTQSRLPESAGLDCSDVPRFIRNSVTRLEQAADSFSSSRLSARSQNRRERLLDDVSDARSLLEDRVEDENPCKNQLLGRVDRSESLIRGARVRQRRSQSCDARFPSLDERITAFEDDVLTVESPVSSSTFDNFINRANSIISDIESEVEPGDRCADQFIDRVNGAIDRLEDIGTNVRISVESIEESVRVRETEESEASQQRETVISRLREQLDELRRTSG